MLGIFQLEVTEYPTSRGLSSKDSRLLHTTGKVKAGSCSFHDSVAVSPKTLVLSPFLSYRLCHGNNWASPFLIQLIAEREHGSRRPLPQEAQSFHLRRNLISRSNELSLTTLWLELCPPTLPKTGPHVYPRPLTRKRKGIAITMIDLGQRVSNFTACWNHPGRLTYWCLSLPSRDFDEIVLEYGPVVRFKFPRWF